MSPVDDCDSGLLELKGIDGCSVGNLFVACLELSMFISVVIGIFLTGNLGDCVGVGIVVFKFGIVVLCLNFGLAGNLSLSDLLVYIGRKEGCRWR